jgi:hypothetical protein
MFGSLFNPNTAASSSWAPGWASQLYQPSSMPGATPANSWGAGMYQPQSMGMGDRVVDGNFLGSGFGGNTGLLADSLFSPKSLGSMGGTFNGGQMAAGLGLLADSMNKPASQMQAPQAQLTPGRYIPIEELMKMMGATTIPYQPQRSPYG